MRKPWLQHYPEGIPESLSIDPGVSLASLFERSFEQFAERPAIISGSCTLSYAELDDMSARFATWLLDSGLVFGDRVAVMLPNLPQYPVALLGILRAGLVCVNINPLYTATELHHLLEDSGARAIITSDVSAAVVEKAVVNTEIASVILTGLADLQPFARRVVTDFAIRGLGIRVPRHSLKPTTTFRRILADSKPIGQIDRPIVGADLAILQYTGGTTGPSKGAMLSHGNLVANLLQVSTWFGSRIVPGEELIVTALPLYHVYALTCNCLSYLHHGGANILIPDPRNLDAFVAEIAKHPFTAITGVNTLYQALLGHEGFRNLDFSTLKYSSSGGMAVQEATAMQWLELTGRPLLEGYGLSETSPVVCSNPADIEAYTGSVGLPLPGTDVSIRDDEGVVVAIDSAGELCVSGPQVMSGYWRRDDLDAQVFTEDGYFRTGDIATMDEMGYVRIVDRKNDMVLVSGFNVYPNEVENAATLHPGIAEAACIGVEDARTGEAVHLFVVVAEGANLDESDVIEHCRQHLAAYKVPRHVEFRDTLPKSNVGKILRRELR
jgi:long-chain acyl-CoA synthetase